MISNKASSVIRYAFLGSQFTRLGRILILEIHVICHSSTSIRDGHITVRLGGIHDGLARESISKHVTRYLFPLLELPTESQAAKTCLDKAQRF